MGLDFLPRKQPMDKSQYNTSVTVQYGVKLVAVIKYVLVNTENKYVVSCFKN